MTGKEIKKMIIENFIDYYTTNDDEREQMKGEASTYVDEDHVDEIDVITFQIKDLIDTYKTKLVFVENMIWANFDNQDSDTYKRLITKKGCYESVVVELERILIKI